MEYEIIHNQSRQRFELSEHPEAYVEYECNDGHIVFTHTIVPREWEGKGLGSALVKAALDDARARQLIIEAQCPFVKVYLERHPEYLL